MLPARLVEFLKKSLVLSFSSSRQRMEIKIRCDYRDENEALDLDQGNYPSKTPKKKDSAFGKPKINSDLPDSNQRPKDLSAHTTVLRSTNWAKVGLCHLDELNIFRSLSTYMSWTEESLPNSLYLNSDSGSEDLRWTGNRFVFSFLKK